jgi:hypothetical protein
MNWLLNLFQSIVFQTVMSGVLVFVLSEIIQKIFLEPFQKYKGVVGKIDSRLKFYFKIIENPGTDAQLIERLQICSQELLQLSCDLESCRKQLIFRSKQTDKNVSQASKLLIDLHFGVFGKNASDKNLENIENIRKLLNVPKLSE